MKSLKSKIIVLFAALGQMLGACQAAEAPATTTVAVVASSCPDSHGHLEGWDSTEGAFLAPLVSALLPSVVGGAWNTLAAAVHAKATKTDTRVTTRTGTQFYSADSSGVLLPGPDIGCLFFSTGTPGASPALGAPLADVTGPGKVQLKNAGINAQPSVYLEASFEFSSDHTAFRLLPQRLYYERSIENAKKHSTAGLALVVTFRKPSAASPGDVFAVGALAFPFARPNTTYIGNDLGSDSRRITSNWMPLPALDSQVTQRLSAVSQNAQTASTDAARIATLLAQKSSSGKPLSERNDLLGGSVAGTPFCPYAAATRPAMTVPTDYQKWQASLDVELERLTRWKADLDIPGQTATPTQRVRTSPAAADAAAQLDLLRACSEAARARAKIRDDLEFLVRNTPVDVEVTLTETLDPNKFLVWADTVLTDSKATGVTAIVNQLDPTKRAADEKTAAVSREQAEDAARRAWTDGKKAEIDVAQLADGSADKQKQQLELDLKKRSANRSYAALGWVVPFPEVFP